MNSDRISLSSDALKLIAVVSMLIDHVGKVFFHQHEWLRHIGRLAMPLFIFVMVEGFFFTHDRFKYLGRLLIFAVISEAPFDLGLFGKFPYEKQNVYFTLALGMIAMILLDLVFEKVETEFLQLVLQTAVLAVCMVIAYYIHSDYRMYGVCAIAVAYVLKKRGFDRFLIISVIVAILVMMNSNEFWAFFDVIPVALYDGKKPTYINKWFFYAFYPVHLSLIFVVRYILYI